MPKRHQNANSESDAPPNTPKDYNRRTASTTSTASIGSAHDSIDSPLLPGSAKRVGDVELPTSEKDLHHIQIYHTASSPISTYDGEDNHPLSSVSRGNTSEVPTILSHRSIPIDPADRECLERFLKINVRHITDGQGVVSGVLLITPNALMFDPNVSDPLVIEHGAEMYGVTIPTEIVLKTALYSDIAHMRVKHAPGAVPSVPKPTVYYGSDDESSCFFEDNLKNAIDKKSVQALQSVGNDNTASDNLNVDPTLEESISNESDIPRPSCQSADQSNLPETQPPIGTSNEDNPDTNSLKNERSDSKCSQVSDQLIDFSDANSQSAEAESSVHTEAKNCDKLTMSDVAGPTLQNESGVDNPNRMPNTLSSHFQSKLALGERHSAPLAPSDEALSKTPPLVSAVSADETSEIPNNKRRSAHGESRREQMLKRLSNPVDTIGNLTKSGLNSSINATKSGFNATKSGITTGLTATKTGISSGLNATKSGLSTGIMATKSGLTTGLNVTKTGFNKVLSTPKNLMELGRKNTGSKEGMDEDFLNSEEKDKSAKFGYTNMVETKGDAFENIDSKSTYRGAFSSELTVRLF